MNRFGTKERVKPSSQNGQHLLAVFRGEAILRAGLIVIK